VLDFELLLFTMGQRLLILAPVIHLDAEGFEHLFISTFSVHFRGQGEVAELLLLVQALASSLFFDDDGLADFALIFDESFGLHFGV